MQPELEEDVIALEGGIGGKVFPPVTVSVLPPLHVLRGVPHSLNTVTGNGIGELKLRRHAF
jgi:hypothetical protein